MKLWIVLLALAALGQQAPRAPQPVNDAGLPVRKVWKTYPVYHPDKAPPDYIEWLRTQAPEEITAPDGETLFHAPMVIGSLGQRPPTDPPFLHDKAWFDRVNPPLNREGAITGLVYVLRTKGKVEIGTYSCATCHTRVMRNGAVIKGAAGNFPVEAALAVDLEASAGVPAMRDANKDLLRRVFGFTGEFSIPAAAKLLMTRAAGQIPDLNGVGGRRYLTHTGLYEIQSPADLARYVAGKQHLYAPDARASAEQVQALAQYIGGLKAPASPVKADKTTRLGEKIFEREGCAQCHTKETKLTPVAVVGTDPAMATDVRTGTGSYRVPSLQGLWYRGTLSHTGQGTSLEDWLSPVRLQYLKGHEYGFKLSATDRFALIAYLRTL